MTDFPANGAVGDYNWGTVDVYGRVLKARQSDVIFIEAVEQIPAFYPVIVDGHIANSGIVSHESKFVGISKEKILPRYIGQVQTAGELINNSWRWTTGSSIYINGTLLSQTAPVVGWVKIIGVAKNSTTIIISGGGGSIGPQGPQGPQGPPGTVGTGTFNVDDGDGNTPGTFILDDGAP